MTISDKYSITLVDIEQSRDDANAKLEGFLQLGMVGF